MYVFDDDLEMIVYIMPSQWETYCMYLMMIKG